MNAGRDKKYGKVWREDWNRSKIGDDKVEVGIDEKNKRKPDFTLSRRGGTHRGRGVAASLRVVHGWSREKFRRRIPGQ
jgi:hypothetical protein